MSSVVDTIDISGCESAEDAAETVGQQIKAVAESIGQKPDLEVTVKEKGENWLVAWPGGPFDWAIKLTGGEPIIAGDPEITGFRETVGFDAECKNGSTLVFFDH